jgi:nucleoside 2-deoxyribosyltransferase
MPSPSPLTLYLAGELFSLKHLYGNAVLAETIYGLSSGRYVPILPQNLEQRGLSAQAIRDQDLEAVLACDVGLFHYDGTELDSGTVVEYLFAKFADIPSVLLRTDFRSSGDQTMHPWNLMTSYFPRTEVIVVDAMGLYQGSSSLPPGESPETLLKSKAGSAAAQRSTGLLAEKIIAALDRVTALPPLLPKHSRRDIYAWLARMPGFIDEADAVQKRFLSHLERKEGKGLL